ncbi:MFS transporter [Actinocatenispora comari]|jgi:MFS family permease|uniref:MFS transporter n=1 Tax=Actinocatenispora comari TaxID=2807577 RepID=A0A8J4AFD2_9ACTN|nr:MFS transporter [Actinocatenispora comari]GIL29625.1 MFS transporter [Actinocatenispora comari]
MSLTSESTTVTRWLVLIRVVNRLGAFAMGFLSLRLTHDLGASLALAGLVLAAFGAGTIPSRLLGGVLATRFGARTAMLTGLLACATAQATIALGTSVPVVIAGALLLGLAYELVEPATQALIAQSVPSERRASSYSLLWAALAVAGVVAGVFAAVLTRWSIGALFLADAATSLAAAAVVWRRLPADRPLGRTEVRAAWRAVLSARLAAWTAVGSLYATLAMLVVFMLPLAVQAGGHPATLTGWLLATAAAAAIAAQRVVAATERRLTPATMLTIGYLSLTAGLLLWSGGTVPELVAGAVFEGASGSLLLGTQQAIASRLGPPSSAATVLTGYGLSWGVGTVVAPLLGTPLLAHGTATLWLATAAGAACLALGTVLYQRIVPRRRVAELA